MLTRVDSLIVGKGKSGNAVKSKVMPVRKGSTRIHCDSATASILLEDILVVFTLANDQFL